MDICSAAPSSWLRHCHAPRRQLAPSLFQTCVYFPNMPQIMHMLQLLMRLAQYARQALCNGPVSVRPSVRQSVCLSRDGRQQLRTASLPLSARAGIECRSTAAGAVLQARRRSAANAGSVMLRSDEGGSTQTRYSFIFISSLLRLTQYARPAVGLVLLAGRLTRIVRRALN